jgi:hypothetical protein
MKTILVWLTTIIFLLSGVAYAGTYTDSAHGQNITRFDLTGDANYNPAAGGYAIGNCAHCHEAHASIGGSEPDPQKPNPDEVLLFDYEEALCEACHDGNPVLGNIQFQIRKTYAHPTELISGKHKLSENGPTMNPSDYSYTSGNRHAECVDCHNPHAAGATAHTKGTNAVGSTSPIYKVSGIGVNNSFAWSAPSYTKIPVSTGITKEYQLCFKCHSSWTNQPSGQTNVALQFNTVNPSAHPVEDTLTNSSSDPLNDSQLNAEWRPAGSKTMYCSDCHGSETPGDPAGPHGSTLPTVLKGRWPKNSSGTLWVLMDAANNTNNFDAECLCKNCHPIYSGGAFMQRVHRLAGLSGSYVHNVKCVICHVGLPHGSEHGCLIAYTADAAPYNYEGSNAEITHFTKQVVDGDYDLPDCSVPQPNSCLPEEFAGIHP